MERQCWISSQTQLFWRFLGFFQKKEMRLVHLLVLLMVIMQLLSSMAMKAAAQPGSLRYLADSWHILFGTLLLPLSWFFSGYSLRTHGFKHFYPYLWGSVEQLCKDVRASLRLQLVGPKPGGLPAVVQGLGLGALLVTVTSGFSWFMLWHWHSPYAGKALEIHKIFALLMGLYVLGHGGMALLHFVRWQRSIAGQKTHTQEPPEA